MTGSSVSSGGRATITLQNSPIRVSEIKFTGPKIDLIARSLAVRAGSGPDDLSNSIPDPEWGSEYARRIFRYTPGNIMTGDDVKRLQQELIAIGISVGPDNDDGEYGRNTWEAVKRFQRQYGLTRDGIVGPAVRGVLGISGHAAYRKGIAITVDAKFTTSDHLITSARIWASDGTSRGRSFGGLREELGPLLLTASDYVNVTFGGGVSTGGVGGGFYRFQIKNIPDRVGFHNVKWLWRCADINSAPSPVKSAGTSRHQVYIIHADPAIAIEPAPHPIQWMQWACQWAEGAINEREIGDKIQRSVNYSNPPYFNRATGISGGAGCVISIWQMMRSQRNRDTYAGSCSSHANLMVHAAALLGVSSRVAYVYPIIYQRPDGTYDLTTVTGVDATDNQRSTAIISGVSFEICPYVMTSGHAINNYEGCAVIDGRFYAGGVDRLQAGSAAELFWLWARFNGRYAALNNWVGPDYVGDQWFGLDSPIQHYGDDSHDVPTNKRLHIYNPNP